MKSSSYFCPGIIPKILTVTLVIWAFSQNVVNGDEVMLEAEPDFDSVTQSSVQVEDAPATVTESPVLDEKHQNESLAQKSQLICPGKNETWPCICVSQGHIQGVVCHGANVTQAAIDNVLVRVRQLNSFNNTHPTPNGSLHLHWVVVQHTNLTQLDLSAFLKMRISLILIRSNPHLRQISGPKSTSSVIDQIEVNSLDLRQNHLTDFGLKDTLTFFNTTSLVSLVLQHNGIAGSASTEFLPGLSAFSNLRILDLQSNLITTLIGGQFKKNAKLDLLSLAWNPIAHIEEDAFFLEDADPTGQFLAMNRNRTFQLHLQGSRLTCDKIDVKSGIERLRRPTHIHLWANKFQFIAEEKFRPFLTSNKLNSLIFNQPPPALPKNPVITNINPETGIISTVSLKFKANPLQVTSFDCKDSRMKWLNVDKIEFQQQIINGTCSNDPANTIFTANLA